MKVFLPVRIAFVAICFITICIVAGCGENTPQPLTDTSELMPREFRNLYLGIAKDQVERLVPAQETSLGKLGLQTSNSFVRDSVIIGVAMAYRDDRLVVATIWNDCNIVPNKFDSLRHGFLTEIIERNGPSYQHCSFNIPGVDEAPDFALYWSHPQAQVLVTIAKGIAVLPDSTEYHPYYQFCMFNRDIEPYDIWPNLQMPALEADGSYFDEADSIRDRLERNGTFR